MTAGPCAAADAAISASSLGLAKKTVNLTAKRDKKLGPIKNTQNMNNDKNALAQKLRAWWKKATADEKACMRCGHCSHLCRFAGLKTRDKAADKAKGV